MKDTVENIKERLRLLYDDQHVIKLKQANHLYSVLMRLPKSSIALADNN